MIILRLGPAAPRACRKAHRAGPQRPGGFAGLSVASGPGLCERSGHTCPENGRPDDGPSLQCRISRPARLRAIAFDPWPGTSHALSCFRADQGGLPWRPTPRVGDLPANRQGAVRYPRTPGHGPCLPGRRPIAPAPAGQARPVRRAHGRSCCQWTAVPEAMASGKVRVQRGLLCPRRGKRPHSDRPYRLMRLPWCPPAPRLHRAPVPADCTRRHRRKPP